MTPTPAKNTSTGQAMGESLTWRDFTYINGTRYRITERQRVDYYAPKPGDTSRKPELIHVAYMACRVEVA